MESFSRLIRNHSIVRLEIPEESHSLVLKKKRSQHSTIAENIHKTKMELSVWMGRGLGLGLTLGQQMNKTLRGLSVCISAVCLTVWMVGLTDVGG